MNLMNYSIDSMLSRKLDLKKLVRKQTRLRINHFDIIVGSSCGIKVQNIVQKIENKLLYESYEDFSKIILNR